MRNGSHEPLSTTGPPAGSDPTNGENLLRSDPEQLGALLRDLQPRLRAVAMRYTRDADAAQDVLQNAFEKVIRHCDQFRGGSLPSTWMHRIVANEALMWLRSEKRRSQRLTPMEDIEHIPVEDQAPAVPELLEQHEGVARVRRAIALLRPEEQQVIERCALEDRSYRQFSSEFGVHPAAAKSRAFRARRRLGQLLATREIPPPALGRTAPGKRTGGDRSVSPRSRGLR